MRPNQRIDGPPAERRGIVRSLVRKGSRDSHSPDVDRKGGSFPDPTRCTRCGAIYHHRTWRLEGRRIEFDASGEPLFHEGICPACTQVRESEYYGRVLLRASRFLTNHEPQIRGRIQNIAARARFTQPERKIVEIERLPEGLEVRTTSQKLAHRIAHELVKSFRGHATYDWSDRDGELRATWARDDVKV